MDGIADYTCECDVAYEGKNCDIYVGKFQSRIFFFSRKNISVVNYVIISIH